MPKLPFVSVLLPDELLYSYLLRLSIANGFDDIRHFTEHYVFSPIYENKGKKYVAVSYDIRDDLYQFATSVGYFRGGGKDKEIDIVVDYPNVRNILIEVKYRDGAPIADDAAISKLCEDASAAIIVTKNADDFGVHHTKTGKEMLRIPAFAFLYLLGNAEKHGYRGVESFS